MNYPTTLGVASSHNRLVQEDVQEDMKLLENLAVLLCKASRETNPSDYPHATAFLAKLPIYFGPELLPRVLGEPDERRSLMQEFQQALFHGPGVFVIKNMIDQDICESAHSFMLSVTPALEQAKKAGTSRFEEKLALADPKLYAAYYSNPILALVCEAWLGPAYQVTSVCGSLKSGADQQELHRDYHLSHWGDRVAEFPLVFHLTNQFYTLQAAIAHTAQPLNTGPTGFLPYSQQLPSGYLNIRHEMFRDWVKPRLSRLPLEIGDAVFFNPATFHQPGINETSSIRTLNLFQVNSCMSRPMETKNTLAMTKAVWPVFKEWSRSIKGCKDDDKAIHPMVLESLIAATCEEYEYPRNGDKMSGPGTEGSLVRQALQEGWTDEKLFAQLDIKAAART